MTSQELLLFHYTQLFNNILTQERYPESWCIGIIKPLHKTEGDPKDPKNYRGTSLLPIIGKLFTQILANRIASWADKHNILYEAQYGFCKGRRTTDPNFILSQVILYGKQKSKPVFTCFVDLAKPFDSPKPAMDKTCHY